MQDNIHGRKMSTTLLWIISASTWGSDQTIRSNVQLNAARTENAVAKTPCLNPTGLYDPTKHKSILAVTYHLNRKQKSIFNATIPCPRTVPTEHGTITKHNLQRMNAIPYPQKKDVDNIVLNASLHPLQNRNFNSVFDVQRPFRAKGLRPTPQNRNILPQFLTSNVHFRKGCMQGAPQNRNFTSVLDGQHPFRAKGLRRTN